MSTPPSLTPAQAARIAEEIAHAAPEDYRPQGLVDALNEIGDVNPDGLCAYLGLDAGQWKPRRPAATPSVGVPIVFLDTETTSLDRRTRRIWDIAAIRREPDGTELTYAAIVNDVDLTHADPRSLAIGRFYTRHPRWGREGLGLPATEALPDGYRVWCEADVARWMEGITRGAHLVGAVPSFDEETLDGMLRRHAYAPAWHHHLVDIEALAAAVLGVQPPWNSRELSAAVGVDPAGFDAHTALGDTLWARAVYDAVFTRPAVVAG